MLETGDKVPGKLPLTLSDERSVTLADYAGRIYRLIGDRGLIYHGYASIDDKGLEQLGEACASFAKLISAAVDHARAE